MTLTRPDKETDVLFDAVAMQSLIKETTEITSNNFGRIPPIGVNNSNAANQ